MSRLAWRIVMWIAILSMQVYILSTHIIILLRADQNEIRWWNYTIGGTSAAIIILVLFALADCTRQHWKECNA